MGYDHYGWSILIFILTVQSIKCFSTEPCIYKSFYISQCSETPPVFRSVTFDKHLTLKHSFMSLITSVEIYSVGAEILDEVKSNMTGGENVTLLAKRFFVRVSFAACLRPPRETGHKQANYTKYQRRERLLTC